MTVGQAASKEWSTRSGLGGSGRVGTTAVVQARDISQATTVDSVRVGGGATRGEGDDIGVAMNAVLRHIVTSSSIGSVGVGNLRDTHVRSLVTTIARIDDRGVSRHIVVGRHGNWSSALGKVVVVGHAESAERTNKTTKAIRVGSWIVYATSNVVSSLGRDIGRGHVVASLIVVVGGHDGRIVVRHGHFLMAKRSAASFVQKIQTRA